MLVYSPDDPVTPAKVVEKFMDSTKVLSVNGVFIDGSFIEPDSFAEFCKMPGKAEVLSQLLSLINTPATNLLRLISAPAAQMVRVIAAYKEVLESRGN
jgi:large subunit ribosomal protein L10